MRSELRPLRELCSLIADCPHSTPVWTDSGYVVIRNQNIKNGRLDLNAPSFTDADHFAHRTRRAKPTAGDIIFNTPLINSYRFPSSGIANKSSAVLADIVDFEIMVLDSE